MGQTGTAVATIFPRRDEEMIAVLLPILLFAMLTVVTLAISFYCVEIVLRLIARGLVNQLAQTPEPVRVQTASRPVTAPLRAIRA